MPSKMTWEEIRKAYPQKYVLLRDCQEVRSGDLINILGGEVISSGSDSKVVYHKYLSLKNKEEIIFGYTGWEKFEIEERPFIGY